MSRAESHAHKVKIRLDHRAQSRCVVVAVYRQRFLLWARQPYIVLECRP